MTDLGVLPTGSLSFGPGINNAGQVVGYSYVSSTPPLMLVLTTTGNSPSSPSSNDVFSLQISNGYSLKPGSIATWFNRGGLAIVSGGNSTSVM
jgi:hypothetical protein